MRKISGFESDILFAYSRMGNKKIYTPQEAKDLSSMIGLSDKEVIIASLSLGPFVIYLIRSRKILKVKLTIKLETGLGHVVASDSERIISKEMASIIFGLDNCI